jgi:8-oxo-dGTP diphosphatase
MWRVDDGITTRIRWKKNREHEDVYICDHPKRYTLQQHNIIFEGEQAPSVLEYASIPEWCPLPDLKDSGVKTGVTVMMLRDGKVLLGERGEQVETAKNIYAFPGGRMDYGEETPEDALVREIEEETGLVVDKEDLLFYRPVSEFFPKEHKHYVSLVYILALKDGEPTAVEGNGKCKGWEWFLPEDVPENTFIHTKNTIKSYFGKNSR